MKIAVVLFNLGGPLKSEDIRPFLRNLFSDKAIIDLPFGIRHFVAFMISTFRAPKAKINYDFMGGYSPLLENTEKQRKALEIELGKIFENDEIKCFIAMRYWHPFSRETSKEVTGFAPDLTITLPLYPQFSVTTSGSSQKEWKKFYSKPCLEIKNYSTLPEYVEQSAASIMAEYERLGKPINPLILFSAHGLPKIVIEKGDIYQKEIENSAAEISKKLNFETKVCYQSKVGPLEWLGPSTEEVILQAAKEKRGVIIYPIAFVSEHIETLVELDIEYAHLAKENEIPFYGRAKTLGENQIFISGLARLIKETISKVDK